MRYFSPMSGTGLGSVHPRPTPTSRGISQTPLPILPALQPARLKYPNIRARVERSRDEQFSRAGAASASCAGATQVRRCEAAGKLCSGWDTWFCYVLASAGAPGPGALGCALDWERESKDLESQTRFFWLVFEGGFARLLGPGQTPAR